ncbi:hypothetical protein RKD37_005634 [Streptomyces ambofaciens]
MVPSSSAAGALRRPAAGRRKTKVLPDCPSSAPDSASGDAEAAASAAPWAAGASCRACGTRGSAPRAVPGQATGGSGASVGPPDGPERSAPQAVADSGRLPCWAAAAGGGSSTGSSSKKCGPVSSTEGRAPGGGASGSPSLGAGRLVPATQEAPFQYRTYPGMDGSG